jgi:hypothetical protein
MAGISHHWMLVEDDGTVKARLRQRQVSPQYLDKW